MGDMKNKKSEKMLIKEFRGMKERFSTATTPSKFKAVAEIFLTDLCLAYDINDIKVNEAAIKAYHEVCIELDQRLSNKHEGYRQSITHFIYILKPFMDRFYIQAGRIYD